MPARDLPRLVCELETARQHFGLAGDTPICTCYEAGRDGFWLHRALSTAGIVNVIVDSASIEENRRARQAKTDRLDATALLRLLIRHAAGETPVWRVVHVPTVEEEDRRHAHRELTRLTREHTRGINRIKGLLAVGAGFGIEVQKGPRVVGASIVSRLRGSWRIAHPSTARIEAGSAGA